MQPYSKDFKEWFDLKFRLERRIKPISFNEREIWWTAVGNNVGHEEDGKGAHFSRPVIIVRKFNRHLFWGVPTTSHPKQGKYYLTFQYGLTSSGTAMLSQLRVFDSKRLLSRKGMMPEVDFINMQLQLILILRNQPKK